MQIMANGKPGKAKTKAGGARNPEKYEYAFLLYMQKTAQKDICRRAGVSVPTLAKWKNEGGWEAKRAAGIISVDEIIAKTLMKVNAMLEADSFNADAFAKAVAQLKALKGSATVNDVIDCFSAFSAWVVEQRAMYPDSLTDEFIKQLTCWQDRYVQYRLGNASSGKQ
jgi:hypothetical protein